MLTNFEIHWLPVWFSRTYWHSLWTIQQTLFLDRRSDHNAKLSLFFRQYIRAESRVSPLLWPMFLPTFSAVSCARRIQDFFQYTWTQCENHFAIDSGRQNRKKKFSGRKDFAMHQTKIIFSLVEIFCYYSWCPCRVLACLLNKWTQCHNTSNVIILLEFCLDKHSWLSFGASLRPSYKASRSLKAGFTSNSLMRSWMPSDWFWPCHRIHVPIFQQNF